MFKYINLRLQEILGCLKPFGGVSVIAFGDVSTETSHGSVDF